MQAFNELADLINDNARMRQQIETLKRMTEKAQIKEAEECKSLLIRKDSYFPKLEISDVLNVFGWEANAEAAMIMQSYEPKKKVEVKKVKNIEIIGEVKE